MGWIEDQMGNLGGERKEQGADPVPEQKRVARRKDRVRRARRAADGGAGGGGEDGQGVPAAGTQPPSEPAQPERVVDSKGKPIEPGLYVRVAPQRWRYAPNSEIPAYSAWVDGIDRDSKGVLLRLTDRYGQHRCARPGMVRVIRNSSGTKPGELVEEAKVRAARNRRKRS